MYGYNSRNVIFLWTVSPDIIISSAKHIADFEIDHKD